MMRILKFNYKPCKKLTLYTQKKPRRKYCTKILSVISWFFFLQYNISENTNLSYEKFQSQENLTSILSHFLMLPIPPPSPHLSSWILSSHPLTFQAFHITTPEISPFDPHLCQIINPTPAINLFHEKQVEWRGETVN